jgi:hypothetical protein
MLVALAGGAFAAWTWGRWPDVLVDFGRELYVPWRLAEGDTLYRDLAWFNGPLSPHLNALLFRVFGVSLSTLVWANLALLAALVTMLYRLFADLAGRVAATSACVVLLAVFGFGHFVFFGNYNWVTPYSHEATHGTFLGFASLAALHAWGRGARPAWLVLAGLCLGLAFLTKAEVFLGALLGAGTAFALLVQRVPELRGSFGRHLALLGGAALAPVLLAFGLLALSLPVGEAFTATLGSWPSVLANEASELAYYERGMGLDRPAEKLAQLARWALGWSVALAPGAVLAFFVRGRLAWLGVLVGVTLAVRLGGSLVLGKPEDWLWLGAPLPLFMLVAGAAWLVALRHLPRGGELELGLVAFGLAMLAKMILNARLVHYGFVLALPATMVVVLALTSWVPARLAARGADGGVFRAAALGVLIAGFHACFGVEREILGRKTVRVGSGGDAFLAEDFHGVRGPLVVRVLADLERRVPPDGTLAVFPEGVMLNYLTRRRNPTRYVNFMPPEVLFFGEPRMLAAFEADPPDVVVLVHKDTTEYGFRFFGPSYGQRLASWIQRDYRPVERLGDPVFQPGSLFGIQILERKRER